METDRVGVFQADGSGCAALWIRRARVRALAGVLWSGYFTEHSLIIMTSGTNLQSGGRSLTSHHPPGWHAAVLLIVRGTGDGTAAVSGWTIGQLDGRAYYRFQL